MREIAEHARRSLPELRKLAEARRQRLAGWGFVLGRVFSNIRTYGTDLLLSTERTYRATLHGVQHSVGTFLFLEDIAVAMSDQQLADFCGAWLSERKRLLDDAERDLAWFADHPAVALSRAKPPAIAKLRPLRAMPEGAT